MAVRLGPPVSKDLSETAGTDPVSSLWIVSGFSSIAAGIRPFWVDQPKPSVMHFLEAVGLFEITPFNKDRPMSVVATVSGDVQIRCGRN
jgi:hypothetical protein